MNQDYYDKMIMEFLVMKPRVVLESFLNVVLTPKEREEISLRVQIIDRLLKGEPQQKIVKDLKVGVATVERGAREIKQNYFGRVKKAWWRPSRRGR